MHTIIGKLAIAAVLAPLVTSCMQSGGDSAATAGQTAAATSQQVAGLRTASGTFAGASDHITSGSVSVIWTGSAWVISLGPDFSLDGAPDPVVGLGRNGYDPAAKLGALQSDTGAQTYILPAALDIGDYLQVYIWCEQFSVPLGVADLTLL